MTNHPSTKNWILYRRKLKPHEWETALVELSWGWKGFTKFEFFAHGQAEHNRIKCDPLAQAEIVALANRTYQRQQVNESYARHAEKRREQSKRVQREIRNDPIRLQRKRESCRKRAAIRRENDPNVRILSNIRSRLHQALRVSKKSASTRELTGCTIEELRSYLAGHFVSGMSWENYGRYGWHIDHVIPCSKFDLSDPEQQKKCFHYTNLRPLWWRENIIKGGVRKKR